MKKKIYSVVCRTDKYNANRHYGFDIDGEKIIESNLDLWQAEQVLLDLFNDIFDLSCGTIDEALEYRFENGHDGMGKFGGDYIYFYYDIYTYEIREQ